MHDYFTGFEYPVDKVRFESFGGSYKGRGVLSWNSEKGFKLHAFVDRSGPPIKTISFGGLKLITKKDRKNIRMRPQRIGGWALAPNILLKDRLELLQNWLSIEIDSIIFSRDGVQRPQDKYQGSSLYFGIGKTPILPDSVNVLTTLAGGFRKEQDSSDGISIDGLDGMSIRGLRTLENYLELYWTLDKKHWTRSQAWKWPEAASDALSVLAGRSVHLVRRELFRGSRIYVELRRQPKELVSLAILSPMPQSDFLDKIRLGRLIKFFSEDSKETKISLSILRQLFEAARQKSWQATELLTATILEAALRTLLDKPYNPKKKSRLDIKQALTHFRQKYLSEQWKQWCEKVHDAWENLRHRNAHPDWLYTETSAPHEPEADLNDVIFLSKFYGYMILALSGEKDLQANFPPGIFLKK